jgi:2,4-dienoyl-CoA reductase-like NADH-dependent reductase (Old Yellow Enzyme family)/thioredoxin reductase
MTAASSFQHLFTPYTLRSLTVRNRIVVPGHAALFMPPDGLPTERMLHYWLSKARGGVGLIITHVHNVLPRHTGAPPTAMQRDEVIPAYRRVVDALHGEGVKFLVQLNHMGGQGSSRPFGGVLMAPSATPSPRAGLLPTEGETPHAMSVDEIRAVVDAFRQAAARARAAGFDGVEIQGEVSFLLAQFMSPLRNRRPDAYGGSLDNRLRFSREVIAAVRDGIGTDRVVGIRLSGDEFFPGGLTLDAMREIAPRLEATGQLDFMHIGAGPGASAHIPPSYYRAGSFVYLTEAIRQVVGLPLICSQRINDPLLAEAVLARGVADLIGMNRALIADPEMPRKAREGRLHEVRHCIGCNECRARTVTAMPLACAVNPEAGREQEMALEPAGRPRRIMIVGGGPAGLEAARVAALRGHRVCLHEKSARLGGQTLVAARAPGREDLAEVQRYYAYQMELLKVEVRLDSDVTATTIAREAPDALVIATGSSPIVPDLPTSGGARLVEARAVLAGEVPVRAGQRVVVVAGEHHIQALSAADFLADLGCRVEVFTAALYAGAQLEPGTLEVLYGRLFAKGVGITPLTLVEAIEGRTVRTAHALTKQPGEREEIDLVVAACGGRAVDMLYHEAREHGREVHLIGDALAPRRLMDAILDGARLGRSL